MPTTNFQNFDDFKGQNFYMGIDVHKTSWSVTVRAFETEVAHFSQSPVAETLASHLQRRFPGACFHSAYEAGFCGTSAHSDLCRLGINNLIIHPADLPATDKQKKNKTDRRPEAQQELRSLYRLREIRTREKDKGKQQIKIIFYVFGC